MTMSITASHCLQCTLVLHTRKSAYPPSLFQISLDSSNNPQRRQQPPISITSTNQEAALENAVAGKIKGAGPAVMGGTCLAFWGLLITVASAP